MTVTAMNASDACAHINKKPSVMAAGTASTAAAPLASTVEEALRSRAEFLRGDFSRDSRENLEFRLRSLVDRCDHQEDCISSLKLEIKSLKRRLLSKDDDSKAAHQGGLAAIQVHAVCILFQTILDLMKF